MDVRGTESITYRTDKKFEGGKVFCNRLCRTGERAQLCPFLTPVDKMKQPKRSGNDGAIDEYLQLTGLVGGPGFVVGQRLGDDDGDPVVAGGDL